MGTPFVKIANSISVSSRESVLYCIYVEQKMELPNTMTPHNITGTNLLEWFHL